jgi:hypothetical protein
MALDNPRNQQPMLNYGHLCELLIFFGLAYIFPLPNFVHAFIKLHDPHMCLCVIGGNHQGLLR